MSGGVFLSESPGNSAWVIDEEGRGPGRSRNNGVERGARVAETGRLVPRSRAESVVEEELMTRLGGGVNGSGRVNGVRRNGQDPT